MTQTAADRSNSNREAKTWFLIALAGVALLMFVAGFVLVLT